MRHIAVSWMLTVLLVSFLAVPAGATDLQDMDICLCTGALARELCKDPSDIFLVGQVRSDLYLFSVFYANQETKFFCGVNKNNVKLQGKEWRKVTRTIPYQFDKGSKCGVLEHSVSDCPNYERLVCCSQKTEEEKLDDDFWVKPIPELLDEDLRQAIEDMNATEEAPAETPAEPPAGNTGQ